MLETIKSPVTWIGAYVYRYTHVCEFWSGTQKAKGRSTRVKENVCKLPHNIVGETIASFDETQRALLWWNQWGIMRADYRQIENCDRSRNWSKFVSVDSQSHVSEISWNKERSFDFENWWDDLLNSSSSSFLKIVIRASQSNFFFFKVTQYIFIDFFWKIRIIGIIWKKIHINGIIIIFTRNIRKE